jgi:hypothetical protein
LPCRGPKLLLWHTTLTPLVLVQVRALCQNPNGGIPATFLSSQQSDTEAIAVKKELSKVRAGLVIQ